MEKEKTYCKKIHYKNVLDDNSSPRILLGLVISEDDTFITFKTARKTYQINKRCVIAIEDTDQLFRGEHDDEQ